MHVFWLPVWKYFVTSNSCFNFLGYLLFLTRPSDHFFHFFKLLSIMQMHNFLFIEKLVLFIYNRNDKKKHKGWLGIEPRTFTFLAVALPTELPRLLYSSPFLLKIPMILHMENLTQISLRWASIWPQLQVHHFWRQHCHLESGLNWVLSP